MNWIFFDLETAGLPIDSPIIQVAMIAIDEELSTEVETLEVKIKFDRKAATVNETALSMNHYSDEVWDKQGQDPYVACNLITAFANRYRSTEMISKAGKPYKVAQLVGYNTVDFDMPRLTRLFKSQDLFLPAHPRSLDVLQLAAWKFAGQRFHKPENLKLGTLAQHFNIPLSGEAHEALTDVRTTIAVTKKLLEMG